MIGFLVLMGDEGVHGIESGLWDLLGLGVYMFMEAGII